MYYDVNNVYEYGMGVYLVRSKLFSKETSLNNKFTILSL